jgi:hypothetical protein
VRRGCRRRLDARLGNRPDEFLDEERNAASHLVAGRRENRLHVSPESPPHKLGHRPLTQRRKNQDISQRVGGERRNQRRTASRPGRRDDRDRQFLQSSP